jgi:hypothetical protein
MPSPFRLEPADEYTHENSGESNFNESMYFNFFDVSRKLGGFLRIGNRPNERRAETTVCLYRPDGEVLFNFQRPEIDGNDAFEAGGARFEVEEPFRRLSIRYVGQACQLADPLQMADPRKAFTSNPFVPLRLDLAVCGVAPAFGGERGGAAQVAHETEFARGHYEQHHRATGTLEVAGEALDFDGLGLRDHSWGPRSWQAPLYYRWLTANFGEDFGFAATWVADREGGEIRGGFLHRGQQLHPLRRRAVADPAAQPTRGTHDAHQRRHDRVDLRGAHGLRPFGIPRPARLSGLLHERTEATSEMGGPLPNTSTPSCLRRAPAAPGG